MPIRVRGSKRVQVSESKNTGSQEQELRLRIPTTLSAGTRTKTGLEPGFPAHRGGFGSTLLIEPV